jgi:acyl carrier protein
MSDTTANLVTQKTYTVESIQTWLKAQVAEQLSLSPEQIDIQMPLDSYGLTSMQVMIVASRAEQQLGMQIPLMLLMHYPTIATLSERIAEDIAGSDTEVFQI